MEPLKTQARCIVKDIHKPWCGDEEKTNDLRLESFVDTYNVLSTTLIAPGKEVINEFNRNFVVSPLNIKVSFNDRAYRGCYTETERELSRNEITRNVYKQLAMECEIRTDELEEEM